MSENTPPSLEKRVLLASVLSAAALGVYINFFAPKPPVTSDIAQPSLAASSPSVLQEPTQLDSVGAIEAATDVMHFQEEPTVILESKFIRLEVGEQSAVIHSATLKNYTDLTTGDLLKIGGRHIVGRLDIPGHEHAWKVVDRQSNSMSWRCSEGQEIHNFALTLEQDKPIFTSKLNFDHSEGAIPIRLVLGWEPADSGAVNQYNPLEITLRTEKQLPWHRTHLKYTAGGHKVVPRRTYQATLCERFFCQSVKLDDSSWVAEIVKSPRDIANLVLSRDLALDSTGSLTIPTYIGPRDFFSLRDAGFENAFARGFLSQIGLLLVFILKAIASLTKSYGIAIIVLAAGITCIFSPFSIAGFRSMRRMQELQPKVDQIKKKYEKDPQRMNKEIFALFKENKVSPVGGCLPMLIQLPIFFALWSAITQVIELRGASFLWIENLTRPDHLATLPFGIELNLLPILMAVAMYVQSKLTTPKKPISGQPNFMSGPFMSILFGVMFYQVPSALVLYWLTNSLVSIAWYRIAKL